MTTAQIISRNLATPNRWLEGEFPEKLKSKLEEMFSGKIILTNACRSAIYLALQTAGIGKGDEVIIQAYTCNSVPNPILWAGAKPIFADIDPDTLNLDPRKAEEQITDRTKAILIQHTFGRPADIDKFRPLCQKHGLILVEDCAHALGSKYNNQQLGTFGDLSVFSFEKEKGIRALAGGALLVNNEKFAKHAEELNKSLPSSTLIQVAKVLNNYLTWRLLLRRIIANPAGKSLLSLLNKTDFFNILLSNKERVGERPNWYPAKIPNLYAQVALAQLGNIDKFNQERIAVAKKYSNLIKNSHFKLLEPFVGVNLRFPVFHPEATKIISQARSQGLWFGNWYNKEVYPDGVDVAALGYQPGSCPNAEKLASMTINLPNHINITESQINQVANFLNNYGN